MKVVMVGGHHTSALPIIQKLKEQKPEIEIHWIGHRNSLIGNKNPGLEYKDITGLNIPFYTLTAGKVYRTFNIVRLIKVPLGFIHAFLLLLKIKPKLIVSFGGYLAAPVVVMGWLLGIPSVTHEQTVVVGYANKLISMFAKKVMVSWKESTEHFNSKKVVYTGLPLRQSIFKATSDLFVTQNSLPTIYITAGKTGSHKINEVVQQTLPELLSFCNIIHQCGDNSVYKDFETLSSLYKEIDKLAEGKYYLRKFIFDSEIGNAYQAANLVVARSGAHTVMELLALKKPSVLIPIPWVSHNEQFLNAKKLESAGISRILEEKDLSSESFLKTIKYSLNRLDDFILNSSFVIKENSADLISHEILKLL